MKHNTLPTSNMEPYWIYSGHPSSIVIVLPSLLLPNKVNPKVAQLPAEDQHSCREPLVLWIPFPSTIHDTSIYT